MCDRQTLVQLIRRTRIVLDEAGIFQKFGVAPGSIPDYLALVGDAADGIPGCPTGVRNHQPLQEQAPPPRIDPERLP
jgi:5'-3' exonuclease